MKFTIPKRHRLGHHDIDIKYEKGLVAYHDKYAQWRPQDLSIVIDPDMPQSIKDESWLHEEIHAMSDKYLADSLTEYQVKNLGCGMASLFRDLGIELDWSEIE